MSPAYFHLSHLFSAQGSSIFIKAGKSTEQATPGGGVLIQGGEGSRKGSRYGGDGGDLHLIGGASSGKHTLNDRAGNVLIDGGESSGNVSVRSC